MSDNAPAAGGPDANSDERVKEMGGLRKWLIRPELGGIVGVIAVFTFFGILAGDSGMFSAQGIRNWGQISAQFMIIAVG
ncbi:MAG TPA: ABC transporter permease, partial [Roseibacterium sp.]|nr:ABC transporter permease [Roseibacterium sp.]